jgi:dihydroflavonol-4-reductase
MITRMAGAAGRPRPVRKIPGAVVTAMCRLGGLANTVTGRHPGLAIEHLDGLFLRELFVEPPVPRSVDEAIRETAKA